MRAKHLFVGVLLTTAIVAVPLLAQPPATGTPPPMPIPPPAVFPVPAPAGYPAAAIANPAGGLQPVSRSASDWLNSPCLCNGPTGKNGPIGSEFFIMTGPKIPFGSSIEARYANTGWMVEGGARSLFFNPSNDAAWIVLVALTYQYNDGSGRVAPFDYFKAEPQVPVTIRDIHRYSMTFGGGRDWFFYDRDPLGHGGSSLRLGLETGGRWGGEHINLNLIADDPRSPPDIQSQRIFLERFKVYGGYYLAAHADIEVPKDSWVWFAGFRAEWAVNFGDVIPFQNNTLFDVNLLLTTGFRY